MSTTPAVSISAEGLDDARLVRFVAREYVSRPFRIDVEFSSSSSDLDLGSLLGTHVTLSFETQVDSTQRLIDGVVARAAVVAADRDRTVYRARLRPWTWFLRQYADCRVFQNLSVPDIVSSVLDGRGLGTVEQDLTGSYAEREYCVQYDETDANFVHRLLEEEGISYWFKHEDGDHTLVLQDDLTSVGAVDGYGDVPLVDGDVSGVGQTDAFRSWTGRRVACPGIATTRDFDFAAPRVDLTQDSESADDVAVDGSEVYWYPGRYVDADVGLARAGVRLDALRQRSSRVRATGNVRGLQPGYTVTMSSHPRDDQNQDYVVLGCEHRVVAAGEHSGGSASRPWYDGRYLLQPTSNEIRPQRRHRPPRIRGPQTAIVVGPDGSETNTDEYGRVQVQFHWDRIGTSDENSSCWIRCAQSLAGTGWGSFALPRVGQEVVVTFLEGDPDRPLVTGTVYNADSTGPLTLPDEAACTSLKTKTIGAESADQGHELTFDDTADAELITLHSERDFARVVENDDSLTVGFEKQDPGDQTVEIFNNQTVTIGDDDASDGSQSVTVKNNREVTVSEGDDSLTIEQGDWTVSLSSGSVSISAGTEIVLQVGDSQITIDSSGVTINGSIVDVEADGTLTLKGADIDEEASASMTLQGGVVQIN